MPKRGMKHIRKNHNQQKNTAPPVPEIHGSAKRTKERANPIIAGTEYTPQKVYHTKPFKREKPIPSVYAVIDNDLARDNLENDITAADLQDL
ncbi:MAG: hypothetical protein J1E41_00235 [Ruminococcus sp.]|nr:hypothetical protein [Ruminococcus sp.]